MSARMVGEHGPELVAVAAGQSVGAVAGRAGDGVTSYERWWQDNTDHDGELLTGLPEPIATLAAHVLALQGRIDRLADPGEHDKTHGLDCRCMASQCACAYDHPASVCMTHGPVIE